VVDTSEAYEGVLVGLDDVTVVDDTSYDWIVESDGTCHVGRWSGYSYTPVMDDELDVYGVMGEDLVSRKLQPRDDGDIQPATGVPPDELPRVLSLSQNLPNPFGRDTGISYALPSDGYVEIKVYNVAGKVVRTLVDGMQPAGEWSVTWDGKDDGGRRVGNGVYFYSLRAGGRTIEKTMVLID